MKELVSSFPNQISVHFPAALLLVMCITALLPKRSQAARQGEPLTTAGCGQCKSAAALGGSITSSQPSDILFCLLTAILAITSQSLSPGRLCKTPSKGLQIPEKLRLLLPEKNLNK